MKTIKTTKINHDIKSGDTITIFGKEYKPNFWNRTRVILETEGDNYPLLKSTVLTGPVCNDEMFAHEDRGIKVKIVEHHPDEIPA